MDFKTFFLGLPSHQERDEFARCAGTTRGYLNQVAYAGKKIGLSAADVLVAVSQGKLSLDALPLTKRAAAQRAIRELIRR